MAEPQPAQEAPAAAEDALNAAADATDDVEAAHADHAGESASSESTAAASKRKRLTKLEAAEKRKSDTLEKIERKKRQIEKACVNGRLPASKASQVQNWEADIAQLQRELEVHAKQLEDIQASEEKKALAAAAKAQRDALNSEASRHLTEAGAVKLVKIKIKYDPQFNNTSDTSDAVWEHVHAEFAKAVSDGELAESDLRSAQALKLRCAVRDRMHAACHSAAFA